MISAAIAMSKQTAMRHQQRLRLSSATARAVNDSIVALIDSIAACMSSSCCRNCVHVHPSDRRQRNACTDRQTHRLVGTLQRCVFVAQLFDLRRQQLAIALQHANVFEIGLERLLARCKLAFDSLRTQPLGIWLFWPD